MAFLNWSLISELTIKGTHSVHNLHCQFWGFPLLDNPFTERERILKLFFVLK